MDIRRRLSSRGCLEDRFVIAVDIYELRDLYATLQRGLAGDPLPHRAGAESLVAAVGDLLDLEPPVSPSPCPRVSASDLPLVLLGQGDYQRAWPTPNSRTVEQSNSLRIAHCDSV